MVLACEHGTIGYCPLCERTMMDDKDFGFVTCLECGHEQPDMGRNIKCEECGHGPMPCDEGMEED